MLKKIIPFLFLSLILIISCKDTGKDVVPVPVKKVSAEASTYDTKVVYDWYNMHLDLIKNTAGFIAPVSARSMAYTSIASYETIIAGMPKNNSLSGKIAGLENLPKVDSTKEYNWPLAFNTAQYTIITELFSSSSDKNRLKIDSLRKLYEAKLKTNLKDDVIVNSIKFGASVASAVLEISKKDGGSAGHLYNFPLAYVVPNNIGAWRPTSNQRIPALPFWGNNKPLIKGSNDEQFLKNIPFSFEKNSEFYLEAKSLHTQFSKVTNDQKAIALHFADGAGTYTVTGHHLALLLSLMQEKKAKFDDMLTVLTQSSIGLNDAFINTWAGLYRYNLMRPQSYIRDAIQPDWKSLIDNPQYPEYISVQATAAGFVKGYVEANFGKDLPFEDKTQAGRLPNRKYTNIDAYTQEAALSGLYAGTHYNFTIENGLKNGKEIAKKVLALKFKK